MLVNGSVGLVWAPRGRLAGVLAFRPDGRPEGARLNPRGVLQVPV
jgi:hypothetical protein